MQAHLNATLIMTLSGKQMFQPRRLTNYNVYVLIRANWGTFVFGIGVFINVLREPFYFIKCVILQVHSKHAVSQRHRQKLCFGCVSAKLDGPSFPIKKKRTEEANACHI